MRYQPVSFDRVHLLADSWSNVFRLLSDVLTLEAAYAAENGSPRCFSAGRGVKGAEFMAWRLLSAGVQP